MDTLIPATLSALTLTSILFLVAIGMAIVFGMMNVINLAHGEFLTLGAYAAALVGGAAGSFWIGLAVAPLVGAAAGLLLETAIIRHLYRRPLDTIIATLGVSFIVQKGLELTFGPSPISMGNPIPGLVVLFGSPYPAYRIFLIGFAALVMALVVTAYRRTSLGLDLRTAIQDPAMAACVGIDVDRTYRITFATGAALAALAGALIAPMASVIPGMGLPYLIKSFFVVIIGGIGSILGVFAGSAFIGGLETLFSVYLGGAFPQALVLVLAIILVRFRPKGLVPA